jgi:hypothetical protein
MVALVVGCGIDITIIIKCFGCPFGVSNGDDDSATKRRHWKGKDVRPDYKNLELQDR